MDGIQTSDFGFIFAGYTESDDENVSINNGIGDIWVCKIDSNGILLWEKSYGGSSLDNCNSIAEC